MIRLTTRASFFWILSAGALAIAAALSGGCSVLFHADAGQCSTDTDCIARGAPFDQYSRCVQGTCTLSPSSSSSTSTSSTGSTSTSTSSSGPPPCQKNSDCPGAETAPCNSNIACNVDTGQCMQLTTPDCGFVIGDYCGQDEPTYPPIFLGAFAVFQPGDPTGDATYQNYALAVSEFSSASYAPGVPAGPGSTGRTPVVVACDVHGNLDAAMQHLIGDLGISTIVAPIEPLSQLGSIFQTYALPGNNPVDGGPGYTGAFMINPLGADSFLTTPPFVTDGLLWHMLGSPGDVAPAYGALMPLVERYVRHNAPWNLGDSAPMKVATVTANNELLNDLVTYVNPLLTWNGGQTIQSIEADAGAPGAGVSCPCQSNSNYCALTLNDSTLNGTPYTQINYSAIAQCLLQYAPQVIISYASVEFDYVVTTIESTNPSLQPFYLLSPYNGADQPLQSYVLASPSLSAGRAARLAGIEFADPVDSSVFNAYVTRFNNMPGALAAGTAGSNYYDAMYFAIYSLAAAGRRTTVTASEIAGGMATLIGQPPINPVVDMGPGTSMQTVFSDIGTGETISLLGTLGPPNFNEATGARVSQGDVYCLDYSSTDAGVSANYEYDVLRLANADGGPAEDGGGALTGTFPCYSGIQ